MKKIIVFLLVLWLLMSAALYVVIDNVQKHGLRTFLEKVWCGPDGCNR
jgi:hypothetical protein